MAIQLAPDVEASIRIRLEAGGFKNENDVMREAMHLLDLREYRRWRLQESVREGFAAVERGEGIELTDELWESMIAEADEDIRRGIAPDPDVCP